MLHVSMYSLHIRTAAYCTYCAFFLFCLCKVFFTYTHITLPLLKKFFNAINNCFAYRGHQLRVVTQEDVKFQRFRRDEVGVFELKEMIEDNTEKIAANTKSM